MCPRSSLIQRMGIGLVRLRLLLDRLLLRQSIEDTERVIDRTALLVRADRPLQRLRRLLLLLPQRRRWCAGRARPGRTLRASEALARLGAARLAALLPTAALTLLTAGLLARLAALLPLLSRA